MATLRELVIRLSLKADTKAIKDVTEKFKAATSAVGDLVAYGGKLAAVYTGVGAAITAQVASSSNYAEEMLRSASAFGITTDKMQELSFAFQGLGASQDDLADMFGTLTDRATDAIEGSKTYRKEFERLGISIDELKGKNPGELFDLYVRGASQTTSVNDSLTASVRLLGDDLGRRVSRGLRVAGSSFQDYINIVRASGGVFPKRTLEAAQKAQVQFRLLGATFSLLRRQIGLRLAPVFGEVAAKMIRWISKNKAAIDSFVERLVKGVQKEIGRIEIYAKSANKFVQRVFGGWTNLFDGIAVSIAGVVSAIGGAKFVTAVQAVAAAFAALSLPVVLAALAIANVAAVVAALGLAFEDIFVYLNGGDSIIGRLIASLREGGAVSNALAWVLEMVAANVGGLIDELGSLWDEFQPFIPYLKAFGKILFAVFAGIVVGALTIAVGILRAWILLFRIGIGMIKAFFEYLSDFTDELSNSIRQFPEAFMNMLGALWSEIKAFFAFVQGGIDSLLGDKNVNVNVNSTQTGGPGSLYPTNVNSTQTGGPGSLYPTNVVRGANGEWRRPSNAGGGGGNQTNQTNQTNQFDVQVNANSESEGRAAARGFKSELDNGNWVTSLIERFTGGNI